MRGLKPIGRTYYARLLIPKDRQRDVGTAYGVKSGIVEERVRTTGTQDKREAIKRRDVVLAALTHEVNAKLTAAGLPPLHGEWKPDWLNEDVMISEAMEARQALRALSDVSDEKDEIDGWTSPRSREESNFRDLIIDRAAEMTEQGVSGVGEYFAVHPKPTTPHDLTAHNCINIRLPTYGGLYAWELEKDGRALNVRVEGQFVCNDVPMIIDAALSGLGLACLPEDQFDALIDEGRLVRVLEDWCPPFSGYHLYYPSRRQTSPAFNLLVEALRYREL